MRILKKVLIGLGIALALLITASFLLRHQFEDILKKKLVDAINEQLQTRLYINNDIEFSIFQKFPYASLRLREVRAQEVNTLEKDTLLWFDNLYFQFNIMDLLHEKYDIQKIHAEGGFIKMSRDNEGVTNFDIIRHSKDTAQTSIAVALNDVKLSNVRLVYKDEISKQDIDFLGKEIKFKGMFAADNFDMEIDTDLDVAHYISESITYYTGKPAKISLKISVNSKAGTYKINGGKIELADLSLETSGTISSSNTKNEIDLKIGGKNVDLKKALSLLPANIQEDLGDYKTTGKATLDIVLKGEVGGGKFPQIIAGFSVSDGSLKSKENSVDIWNMKLNGTYTNGAHQSAASSELVLTGFSAELDEGSVTGSFSYSNFIKPTVMLNANAKARIEELAALFKFDWMENPSGLAQVKINYSGTLEVAGKFGANDIRTGKIAGEVFLFDGAFQLKENQKKIEELNGKFKFNKEDLLIEKFTGEYAGSDFKLDGTFKNLLPYILDEKERLTIKASLASNKIDMDQLLANPENTSGKEDAAYNLQLSNRVDFDLKLDVNQLNFRRFEARDISGNLGIRDQLLILDNFALKAMQGQMTGKLSLNTSDSNAYPITCMADIKGIDMHDLFYQCENFSQTFIEDKHLKGKADLGIQLNSVLGRDLAMNFKKLRVEGDIVIRNGELIGFEPLKEIAKFVKLDELERVKFSELSNHITIKDETIIIPKMEITSTAIDLAIAGEHHFNNEIEYHFRLLLSDVLGKKAKERKQENTDYAVDEDAGKTYLFLVLKGTVDDYKIAYDTKAVKDKIKDDFKQEKKELKVALNQEFGWFKKDSAVVNHKEVPKKESKLNVEWEDGDSKKNEEGETEKPKFKPLKKKKTEEEPKKDTGSFKVEWE